jgi:hypothetical protein
MFRMIVVIILAEQGVFLAGVETQTGFAEWTFRKVRDPGPCLALSHDPKVGTRGS